jgi:3D (Asp-Asp-Asp) domain-containing protein
VAGPRPRTVLLGACGALALAGGGLAISIAAPTSTPRRSHPAAGAVPPRGRALAMRTGAGRSTAAAARASAGCPTGRPLHEHLITRPRWLRGVAITEYYSTPERWFSGRLVHVPGLRARHRVDWLYSAHGVAMQGDGIGLDGRHYHIDALGAAGWVNRLGHRTRPGRCAGHWSRGRPAWLEGGWRNAAGAVTWPLQRGGWSHGGGRRQLPYAGVTFAAGSSIPLHPYRTLAVDPRLIPRGSRVYIPAYRSIAGGWFVAQDTGGAIIGRHVDVYRPPTDTPLGGGRYLRNQRIYVVPPRR